MRRRAAVVLLAVVALVAAACDVRGLNVPGEGPTRFRDEVFTDVAVTSDLVYGSAVDQTSTPVTLKLDLYQPVGDTATHRPAIVWVHGGSFRAGSKTSGELVDEARTFSRKGYVNVSIDYRLSATGCTAVNAACLVSIQQAKYDAQAAVRWLRVNAATYGIDPDHIAIGGSSAGAITALNVAYGAADVEPGGSNPSPSSAVQAAVSLSGAALLNAPDPGEAPALLFHSTGDPLVAYSWATRTVDLATAAGDHIELTTWDGNAHVPYLEHKTEIITQTTNFLYWMLGLGELVL